MAEMETTEPAKLGRGNLRLADVVAQAVGFMGPVFSVTFFLTAIGGASLTGKGAGINIPISLILAAIGMLASRGSSRASRSASTRRARCTTTSRRPSGGAPASWRAGRTTAG